MSPLERKTGKAYWRSLDDLADSPEFLEIVKNEFPEFSGEVLTPQSRRRFLKLMGASMALAGVTSCRWPEEEIVPFAHRPEGYTPGTPRQYATAMEIGGVATGLLVTAYDGRPVKVEGNPLHPYSAGSSSAQAQASLLGLYDPDRSRHPVHTDGENDAARSWGDFADFASSHFDKLKKNGGRGFYVLAEASSSPSLDAVRWRFRETFPKAIWLEYEPLSRDNLREGSSLAFNGPYRTHLALDEAEIIVSFDADLFLTHPAGLRHIRDFARGRRVDGGTMSRLYAVEACHSLTGSVADHRIPVAAGQIPAVVARIAAELFVNEGLSLPPRFEELRTGLARFLDRAASSVVEPTLVRDLMDHRGRSVIAAGPRQAPEVHALVHLLNEALGNVGKTVRYTAEPDGERPSHLEAVKTLASKLSGGLVDTLLILGGNPVFDAPADLGLDELLSRPKAVIHLGLHRDETSRACHWHLPRAHYLESWGDARAWDGTVSVIQPLIEPLWGGKSPIELLAMILGEPPSGGYDIVRRTFEGLVAGGDFEKRWRSVLHDGVAPDTAWPVESPAVGAGGWIGKLLAHGRRAPVPEGTFEIVFCRDARVHDGRFANNPWLQEQPDPLTRLTWDNPVLIGPADAEALGLDVGDRVRITSGERELELPVYVMPGQAAGSIAVFPGYGRTASGHVGDGVGFDVYPIRTTQAMDVGTCTLEKIGGRYPLATTQDHWAIDALGAAATESRLHLLVREADVEAYRHDPQHAIHGDHHYEPVALWREHDYPGHRWAMSIDLNACVGCGACAVACQAENNIPVVGKEEVARGHEMHWLRIDRYFSGDPEIPAVSYQPVACQHCENAPCESVCPVAATVHDHEGLNVMVYNRCIGTRYCSNNCPYKVRRFNWFNFNKHMTETRKMAANPEVTVRGRGVMEKCTFCVQRINAVKIRAKNDRRPVGDGEIVPACAQACPAEAIVFGDLNDPNSCVRELHEDPRSYAMLEEQNIKPRTRYLARLRNRASEAPE